MGTHMMSKKLSGKVMGMKFMQRKADTERLDKQRKQKDEEAMQHHGAESSNLDGKRVIQMEHETDSVSVLRPGRRSFGGFNKAVDHYTDELKAARKVEQTRLAKLRGKG